MFQSVFVPANSKSAKLRFGDGLPCQWWLVCGRWSCDVVAMGWGCMTYRSSVAAGMGTGEGRVLGCLIIFSVTTGNKCCLIS